MLFEQTDGTGELLLQVEEGVRVKSLRHGLNMHQNEECDHCFQTVSVEVDSFIGAY